MRNRPRLRLADEIRYIQRRAAAHDGRVVTVDQLVLFSTETGDAWLLDPSDHLAARLARDGDPESIALEETDTSFQIAWPGSYRLDGPALKIFEVSVLCEEVRRIAEDGRYAAAVAIGVDDKAMRN